MVQCMQAVRRQLPPPEGPCQASPSGRSQQPSPRPSSHPTHAPSKTPSSSTPSKCIAPEQYVAADEIFKVSTLQTYKHFPLANLHVTFLVAYACVLNCACSFAPKTLLLCSSRRQHAYNIVYSSTNSDQHIQGLGCVEVVAEAWLL